MSYDPLIEKAHSKLCFPLQKNGNSQQLRNFHKGTTKQISNKSISWFQLQ